MANKEMSTLTIGETVYEVVDEKARQDIANIGIPEDGQDGFSPTVTVSKSGKVTTVKITDVNGTKTATINDGADGKTPVKGTDYWTEADKAEIKSYVDEAILNGSW
ncbi:MAG: hypothetical protein IKY90_00015 [Oscillospiraceae bacterium]|nr:hypothetical protein [Oscillospiraceae bacterium]